MARHETRVSIDRDRTYVLDFGCPACERHVRTPVSFSEYLDLAQGGCVEVECPKCGEPVTVEGDGE